jgi:hypothetical protein
MTVAIEASKAMLVSTNLSNKKFGFIGDDHGNS